MSLPLAKVLSLTIRTVAKPFSKILKDTAKQNQRFRQYFVIPVGQATHWIAVRVQRLTLGSTRRDVTPLSEAAALEYGAEFVGEFFIYSVATAVLLAEYNSSVKKAAKHEAQQETRLRRIEDDIQTVRLSLSSAIANQQLQTVVLDEIASTLEKQSGMFNSFKNSQSKWW